MLNKLKNVSLIKDIQYVEGNNIMTMVIGNFQAKASIYPQSMNISLFVQNGTAIPSAVLHYMTHLLAGHPDIHDYAFQLAEQGWCLSCYYDKNNPTNILEIEIEKQLALTHYLINLIAHHSKIYPSDFKYPEVT